MAEAEEAGGISDSAAGRAEQLLGKLAGEVLESERLGKAFGRLLGARASATHVQEAAMGLLNVPTAGDIEKLTRRVRSLSDRLGGIEDSLTRIEGSLRRQGDNISQRLDTIEKELAGASRKIADLEAARLPDEPVSVSRDQEVLLRATSV
jgi:hypothetical protein